MKTKVADQISQSELHLCYLEQELTRQLIAHYGERRSDIRSRYLAGVPQEPGNYRICVSTREEKRVNQESLERLLGCKAAKIIIGAIPRTTRHFMSLSHNALDEFDNEPATPPSWSEGWKADGTLGDPLMSIPELIQLLRQSASGR